MRANYKMQRLFVPDDLATGAEIEAGAQQSHYLMHVLRLAEGAELLLFNGRDGEWSAAIAAKSGWSTPSPSGRLAIIERKPAAATAGTSSGPI